MLEKVLDFWFFIRYTAKKSYIIIWSGMSMDFGEKLRLARLGHRMTLAKLSEKSGVSKSLLSMIERGQSVPTITTFQKIAAALEIPASTLFADNGSGSPRLSRNLDNCGMDRGEVFSLSNSRQDGVPPLGVRVVRKDRRKKMIMPWGLTIRCCVRTFSTKLN